MGYCSLRVIKRPVIEPVSTAEAALHLRVDHDFDEIYGYVAAARAWSEGYLKRVLITQTLQFTISPSRPPLASFGAIISPIIFITPLSWWPVTGVPIQLPMSPVQSIGQVVQRTANGTQTILDPATAYYADASNEPASITLRAVGQPIGSDLSITYTAGYGDTAEAVPHTVKLAIKVLTAFYYEHRGDDDAGDPPAAVKALLNTERLVTFA